MDRECQVIGKSGATTLCDPCFHEKSSRPKSLKQNTHTHTQQKGRQRELLVSLVPVELAPPLCTYYYRQRTGRKFSHMQIELTTLRRVSPAPPPRRIQTQG